jgi:hypothetical protein
VAPQDDPTLEPQQHVLADGLDRLEPSTVHRLRDARRETARVRALRAHLLADEHSESPGNAME